MAQIGITADFMTAGQLRSVEPRQGAQARRRFGAARYLGLLGVVTAASLVGLAAANVELNPYLYTPSYKAQVAEAFMRNESFAVHDLNFDMRALRREHIARMTTTPEVVVLGASHWQEGDASLVPNRRFYNAHVHRDYVEDVLAVSELLLANGRLPKTMVVSVRDLTFSPVASRTDWWWKFFLPEYRAMANRLGIAPHHWTQTLNLSVGRELLSFAALRAQAARHFLSEQEPRPTNAPMLPSMDLLAADGSIRWSSQHQAIFTPQFALADAVKTAKLRRDETLPIDEGAVEAMDRLIGLLTAKGVRVVLAHPPFHPELYARFAGTPYAQALPRVVEVTKALAAKHKTEVVGSFDPAKAGCTAAMFIDREHANAACLKAILNQVDGI